MMKTQEDLMLLNKVWWFFFRISSKKDVEE